MTKPGTFGTDTRFVEQGAFSEHGPVAGKPVLPRFHELLGPGVVGVGLDSLSPPQVTHGDLAAEALQDDAYLVFRGLPAPGSSLNCADEGRGCLCAFIRGGCFTCFCLDHSSI